MRHIYAFLSLSEIIDLGIFEVFNRAELLKAWLALTIGYISRYQNQYVVKVLNVG